MLHAFMPTLVEWTEWPRRWLKDFPSWPSRFRQKWWCFSSQTRSPPIRYLPLLPSSFLSLRPLHHTQYMPTPRFVRQDDWRPFVSFSSMAALPWYEDEDGGRRG